MPLEDSESFDSLSEGSEAVKKPFKNVEAAQSTSSSQTTPPCSKKSKRGPVDEVDEVILKMLASTENTDDDEWFGKHISAILRRFSPKKKAQAKLQLEQVLVNIEFPKN